MYSVYGSWTRNLVFNWIRIHIFRKNLIRIRLRKKTVPETLYPIGATIVFIRLKFLIINQIGCLSTVPNKSVRSLIRTKVY